MRNFRETIRAKGWLGTGPTKCRKNEFQGKENKKNKKMLTFSNKWLFIMYISDKTSLEAHSLVGGGILGMAVIFLFCWLGVKALGMKNV